MIPILLVQLYDSALREDPDVVLIGEMRDLEDYSQCYYHCRNRTLGFATLHTNSAAQSIDRMIDVFPPHQQPQIRAQLRIFLCLLLPQRLVPAIGGGRIASAEILLLRLLYEILFGKVKSST